MKKVDVGSLLTRVCFLHAVLFENLLNAIEQILGNNGFVLAGEQLVLIGDLADVNRIGENPYHIGFREIAASHHITTPGFVLRHADSCLREVLDDFSGRAQAIACLEHVLANDWRPISIDFEYPFFVRVDSVTGSASPVPKALFSTMSHCGAGAFGDLFTLQLGKNQNQFQHGTTDRSRRIELLVERYEVNTVLLETLPQVHEVFQGTRNPINLVNNNRVYSPRLDVGHQPPKLRTVEIASRVTSFSVCIDSFPFCGFVTFGLESDVLLHQRDLCVETTIFHSGLAIGADPAIKPA